jgi:DeoR/GlpR family transcriptional regulator of sugar metabolism
MLKEPRYDIIMELLNKEKSMTVEQLSRALYVSLPTIRRDLTEMQKHGLVNRIRGGAMSVGEDRLGIPVDLRNAIHSKEKQRLAQYAASMVKNGDVLFIDASTTALHIIDHLTKYENIRVITNSIQAVALLRKYNIATYCTGGVLIENSLAFGGPYAQEMISNFNIDICFFSSSGISAKGWIVDYSELETQMRKVVLSHAAKRVFLCDQSKFLKNFIYNVVKLADVDCIITDAPLPNNLETGSAYCMVT